MRPFVSVQFPAKPGARHPARFRSDRKKRNDSVFRCIEHYRILDHRNLIPIGQPPFRKACTFKECQKSEKMIHSSATTPHDGNLFDRSFPEEFEANFRVSPVFCTFMTFDRCVRIPFQKGPIRQRVHIADDGIGYDPRSCSRRQSGIGCNNHHPRPIIDQNFSLRRRTAGYHYTANLLHHVDLTSFFSSSRTSRGPMHEERTGKSSKLHQGG